MKKFIDMDGNELKVGDIVLFGTANKRIARAKIVSISEYGCLELHTLKNRESKMFAEWVLLDTTK
ncbi:hypothetical protein [Romboutsia sp.]|uniref:hypothetical protein n=1 Tax=Romboutsia sp. TaxID=1965302 RepID=UPI002C41771D|nr:hypothetical protein [Romboutsia sp.]HSQ89785.1 hypothetical protein [Romboutsia sp.]